MKIEVRKATVMDAVKLLRLNKHAQETERAIPYPPFKDHYALAHINGVIAHGYTWIAEANGRTAGSLGLEPSRFWWNPDSWFLMDAWLYVLPQLRSSGAADALIDAALAEADAKEIPLFFGVQTADRAEAKDRFVERKGFIYAGGIFARGFKAEPSGEGEAS